MQREKGKRAKAEGRRKKEDKKKGECIEGRQEKKGETLVKAERIT